MKKLILIMLTLVFVISCKNPLEDRFGNSDTNSDYAIQSTENGKIWLRFKPEIGNKTITEMKFEIKPESKFLPLDTEIVADYKMRIVAVEDSGAICHLDFQRFRMHTNLMGAKVKYDSQSAENSLPHEMTDELEKFLGKKIIMKVDTLAQVQSITMENETKQVGSKSVDLQSQFISLPKESMGVGDSWIIQESIYILKDVAIKYTIDKISSTEIVIQVASGDERKDVRMIKGQYLMDRKTGFIKKGELDLKDNSQNIGIKISINSTIE